MFADKIHFWPFRLFSEAWIRSFFVKRSGQNTAPFSYNKDLTGIVKRLIILPHSLATLAAHLPFLLEMDRKGKPDDLKLLCDLSFLPLLKALGIEKHGIFANFAGLRYGNPDFSQLELTLQNSKFEVCIMLEESPSLLLLYLARASGAPMRLGLDCEKHYPFLNISYRSADSSPYSFRTHMDGLFQTSSWTHEHPLAHDPANLSSQKVILLNLESSIGGTSWTTEELSQIAASIDPHYRLLALITDPSLLEKFTPLLERLSIRTAPIASSYTAFLDLLRQYRGMISLNSAHAQLAINISKIPTLLLTEPRLAQWSPRYCSNVHIIERGKPLGPLALDLLTR